MIGANYTNIAATSAVEEMQECLFQGEGITSRFEELCRILENAAGGRGKSLLALPERAFSKARQAEIITWYTDRTGVFRTIDTLSQEERSSAEAMLRQLFASAMERADPTGLQLLSLALNLPDAGGILFDGESVLLVYWGFRKRDEPAAGVSGNLPLARYLPPGFNLIPSFDGLAEEDASVPAQPLPVKAAVAEETAQETQGRAAPSTVETGVVAVAAVPTRQAALWLGGLALLLGLFLIYLLWPGNLIYPAVSNTPLAMDATNLHRQNNTALEGQIARLREGMAGNICTAPDVETLDGIGNFPLLSSPGSQPAASIPGASEPAQSSRLPPRAEDGAPLRGADMIERLEKGTVIIVGAERDGMSIGSGLIVSPRHILTNAHVVRDVQAGSLVVSNRRIGTPVAAHVVAQTDVAIGNEDFALLETERELDGPILPFVARSERLESVIAAGYPSFVIESDPNFARAFQDGRIGDIQLAVTRGEITATQQGTTGATFLVHSATISPGNSGGPLVDRCGRVTGINTYIRTNGEDLLRLNFALAAADALKFLSANHIPVEPAASACGETARPATSGEAQSAPAQPPAAGDANPAAPRQEQVSP